MRIVLLILAWLTCGTAQAAPNVVADIAPVHSLVARVMEGIGGPSLVIEPRRSPHGYALRPSQARALERADVVFWIGEPYEPWLGRALAALAPRALVVPLMEAAGVRQLPRRDGARFEDHDHDSDHQHEGVADPHVWLDPVNAMAMTKAIAEALAEADPVNAEAYRANAAAAREELAALVGEVESELAGLKGTFVVAHDAFHHFEARFGHEAAGSFSDSDAVEPGAARLGAIREVVKGATCVFTEPQMAPGRIESIVEGSAARVGTLDPLGAELTPGPGLYPALIRAIARDMRACLDE